MITFKNVQHALATFFKAVVNVAKHAPEVAQKVEAGIEVAEKSEAIVEKVSGILAAGVGGAPAADATVIIEKAAFACLGAVDALLKALGAAGEKKLLDAGMDQAAIDAAKEAGKASQAVYIAVSSAAK